MAELEEREVLRKARVSSLAHVRSLQCWGMHLGKLSLLTKMPNLEILNLSCNDITSLDSLKHCKQLHQVFLRKNRISSFEQVHHLQGLPNLEDVWLAGNPIATLPHYRLRVIQILPQLKQLDGVAVSEGERALASVGPAEYREKLCGAVLSLLPLLDQASLELVQQCVHSLLSHHHQ